MTTPLIQQYRSSGARQTPREFYAIRSGLGGAFSASPSAEQESKDDSSRCLKEANGAEVSQEFGCLIIRIPRDCFRGGGRSRQDPLAVVMKRHRSDAAELLSGERGRDAASFYRRADRR